jgi:hypothetical protein
MGTGLFASSKRLLGYFRDRAHATRRRSTPIPQSWSIDIRPTYLLTIAAARPRDYRAVKPSRGQTDTRTDTVRILSPHFSRCVMFAVVDGF